MRTLVLGGAGTVGQAVARDLIKQEQVKKVILGDIITDSGRLHDKLRTSEKVLLCFIHANEQWPDKAATITGNQTNTGMRIGNASIASSNNYIAAKGNGCRYAHAKTIYRSNNRLWNVKQITEKPDRSCYGN